MALRTVSPWLRQKQGCPPERHPLRHTRQLTQEELADSAGLSARYLGSIERAAVAASVTVLGRLAQALDVDASELIRPLAPVGENGRVFLPEDNPLALVGEIISESAEFSHPGTLRGFTRNPQRGAHRGARPGHSDLHSNINDVCVRSFILSRVPAISMT